MHARDVPTRDVRRGRVEGRPCEPGRSGSVQAPLVGGRCWILDRTVSMGQRTLAQAPQSTKRFLLGCMGLWASGWVFRTHQIGTRRQDGGLRFASNLSGSRSRPRPAHRCNSASLRDGSPQGVASHGHRRSLQCASELLIGRVRHRSGAGAQEPHTVSANTGDLRSSRTWRLTRGCRRRATARSNWLLVEYGIETWAIQSNRGDAVARSCNADPLYGQITDRGGLGPVSDRLAYTDNRPRAARASRGADLPEGLVQPGGCAETSSGGHAHGVR